MKPEARDKVAQVLIPGSTCRKRLWEDGVTTVTMRVAAHTISITHSSAHHPVHLQPRLESDLPRFTLTI